MKKLDPNKKKKIIQAINFMEEFSWLLDSKRNLDLKEIPELLRDALESDNTLFSQTKYSSLNQNKNFLIGVLPTLFQDEEMFRTNVELIDFAVNVLRIPLSKSAKRSRYEYIGLIVCEITKLDDDNLSNLVSALSEITGSNEKLKLLKEERKKDNFSWNDTIHRLNSVM